MNLKGAPISSASESSSSSQRILNLKGTLDKHTKVRFGVLRLNRTKNTAELFPVNSFYSFTKLREQDYVDSDIKKLEEEALNEKKEVEQKYREIMAGENEDKRKEAVKGLDAEFSSRKAEQSLRQSSLETKRRTTVDGGFLYQDDDDVWGDLGDEDLGDGVVRDRDDDAMGGRDSPVRFDEGSADNRRVEAEVEDEFSVRFNLGMDPSLDMDEEEEEGENDMINEDSYRARARAKDSASKSIEELPKEDGKLTIQVLKAQIERQNRERRLRVAMAGGQNERVFDSEDEEDEEGSMHDEEDIRAQEEEKQNSLLLQKARNIAKLKEFEGDEREQDGQPKKKRVRQDPGEDSEEDIKRIIYTKIRAELPSEEVPYTSVVKRIKLAVSDYSRMFTDGAAKKSFALSFLREYCIVQPSKKEKGKKVITWKK